MTSNELEAFRLACSIADQALAELERRDQAASPISREVGRTSALLRELHVLRDRVIRLAGAPSWRPIPSK